VDSSRISGPALVAAAADTDPVTLLVLGWLAAHRSENTRTAYARDIGITPPRRPSRAPSWLTWCQEQGVHPVTGVTMLHVTRYARQLDTAGLSPASAARKLAAVSSWYAWLARRGHIPASPAPGLTQAQALRLLHTADRAPGHQRARTAALVALLLFTGARLSEIISADISDLGTHQGHPVLWVTRGKGRRQGLPLPGPATARIDAYLAGRPGPQDVPALFATGTGRRLFPADVRRTVRRLATRAGLPADLASHLGPRTLQHTFATLYLQAGGSPSDLHGAMGHTDPRTTRQYTPAAPAGQHGPPPPRSACQAQDPALWTRGRPHCRARRPQRAARHTGRLSPAGGRADVTSAARPTTWPRGPGYPRPHPLHLLQKLRTGYIRPILRSNSDSAPGRAMPVTVTEKQASPAARWREGVPLRAPNAPLARGRRAAHRVRRSR
jgi:integrase/recombinase XerD